MTTAPNTLTPTFSRRPEDTLDSDKLRKTKPGAPKIWVWDIERRPAISEHWDLWDVTIPTSSVLDEGGMICWAGKWLGDSKTHFFSVQEHGEQGMIEALWHVLDEADALVSWNGRAFDTKHAHAEFFRRGLTKPSPSQELDLLGIARKSFKFLSNKLDFISKVKGHDGKVSIAGQQLTRECMAGNETAWRRMKRYNVQDVKLTETLYYEMLPWLPQIKARVLHPEEVYCTKCDSFNVSRKGYSYNATGIANPRWFCNDCGSWFRETRRVNTSSVTRSL